MLFTEPMKKIEILVLRSDADRVMRSLGFAGCVQLIAEAREARTPGAEEQEAAELKVRLQSLARFLGMSDEASVEGGSEAPDRSSLARRAGQILEAAKPLV
jgi:vacuolar-type H+-ATPase subunit I/STV1